MLLKFFTVRALGDYKLIEKLTQSISNNGPLPNMLEGGQGIQYLVCSPLDTSNIYKACKENEFEILGAYSWADSCDWYKEVEVPDEQYNNTYMASYKGFYERKYCLEKA